MSTPFLQNSPAFKAAWPSAVLYVEWAPTAPNPSYGDDSTTWTWVDITADVMTSSGIDIGPIGRADQAALTQPAGCTFTLDNRLGAYSRGPQSSSYPNVKLNVPVKVSISLTGLVADKKVRFQGYIWSFRPTWDATGRYAVVSVSAGGATRRLAQRSTPLASPLFRSYAFGTAVRAYWPMEDGEGATQFASGQENGQAMRYSNMNLAAYSGIPGSLALPTLTTASTYSAPVTGDFSAGTTLAFYMNVPAQLASSTAVIRLHMAGSTSIGRWEIVVTGGAVNSITVNGYDASSALAVNNTHTGLNVVASGPIQYVFAIHQNGGNTEYTLARGGITFSGSAANTGSTAGVIGAPIQISMLANANNDGIAIGHIGLFGSYTTSIGPLPSQAWVGDGGDSAVSRIIGLSQEESIPISWNGAFVPSGFSYSTYATGEYTWVGYQTEAAYLDLIRSASDADLGFLGDGLGPGVMYRNRTDMTNQAIGMTLNAATADLMPPFQPEDDDSAIVNKVEASRTGGSSALFEDSSGALGTSAVDIYDDSITVNVRYDEQLLDVAGWLVHMGTVEGYRYPTLNLDMRRIPALADDWLLIKPGDRIAVSNVTSYVSQHPTGTLSLLAEGWSESITNLSWGVTVNCSPADTWRVIALGADSGSIGTDTEFTGRVDSEASTLSAGPALGATSISVATTTGYPLWTTSAGDLPMDLNVGGWRVTCSAISGASSPQTFTISALPASVASGSTVKLWYPPTLAI